MPHPGVIVSEGRSGDLNLSLPVLSLTLPEGWLCLSLPRMQVLALSKSAESLRAWIHGGSPSGNQGSSRGGEAWGPGVLSFRNDPG